jgi:hypothetical protein
MSRSRVENHVINFAFATAVVGCIVLWDATLVSGRPAESKAIAVKLDQFATEIRDRSASVSVKPPVHRLTPRIRERPTRRYPPTTGVSTVSTFDLIFFELYSYARRNEAS